MEKCQDRPNQTQPNYVRKNDNNNKKYVILNNNHNDDHVDYDKMSREQNNREKNEPDQLNVIQHKDF